MRKCGSTPSSNECVYNTSGHHKCTAREGRFVMAKTQTRNRNISSFVAPAFVANNGVPTIKGDTRALDRKIKWSRNEAAMQRMRSRPAPLSIPRILGEAARVLLSNMRIESKP